MQQRQCKTLNSGTKIKNTKHALYTYLRVKLNNALLYLLQVADLWHLYCTIKTTEEIPKNIFMSFYALREVQFLHHWVWSQRQYILSHYTVNSVINTTTDIITLTHTDVKPITSIFHQIPMMSRVCSVSWLCHFSVNKKSWVCQTRMLTPPHTFYQPGKPGLASCLLEVILILSILTGPAKTHHNHLLLVAISHTLTCTLTAIQRGFEAARFYGADALPVT